MTWLGPIIGLRTKRQQEQRDYYVHNRETLLRKMKARQGRIRMAARRAR